MAGALRASAGSRAICQGEGHGTFPGNIYRALSELSARSGTRKRGAVRASPRQSAPVRASGPVGHVACSLCHLSHLSHLSR